MAKFTTSLPNTISSTQLIETDLFTVLDDTAVNTLVDKTNLEASDSIIQFMSGNTGWLGYKHDTKTGVTRIGYNTKDQQVVQGPGLLETEAYSYWIADVKAKERIFKKNLALDTLSQTQYDALFSLYYRTGDFTKVGSEFRKFDIGPYIRDRAWVYIGTALLLSGQFRKQTQRESRILLFADYGTLKTRAIIKEEGIQQIRSDYPDRMLDATARAQAEYVYFKETNRFLPNLTQSRKRQIVQLAES